MISISIVANKLNQVNRKIKKNHVFWDEIKKHDFFMLNYWQIVLNIVSYIPDISKLIQKMKRQPNGIKFQELAKVLEYSGYTMKPKKRNIT